MKKLDVKSIFIGLVIGVVGVSTVFAVVWKMSATTKEKNAVAVTSDEKKAESTSGKNNVATGEGIRSAVINNSKIYFNGKEIELKKPLITIENDESAEPQLYMPMDELLEYMHFQVEWNSQDNEVYLTMGQDNQKNKADMSDISANEADAEAIEIIQKTGNWSYIEKYISQMSDDGIERVVNIYNSKHIDPSQHKNASDYIKN
ncbi:hypothetical protein [Clostridium sp. BL-8]|uniref:hypothetical protein n=1 Tax=Clostridium sp. BL-8 TaxID=349938 RepID=UPI00098C3374|nr:hypothetical protein [Clostridium sp. BL-8]OOM80158.1 hypothetical protein CLOBL_12060 [Clostridium sp. BL-8]